MELSEKRFRESFEKPWWPYFNIVQQALDSQEATERLRKRESIHLNLPNPNTYSFLPDIEDFEHSVIRNLVGEKPCYLSLKILDNANEFVIGHSLPIDTLSTNGIKAGKYEVYLVTIQAEDLPDINPSLSFGFYSGITKQGFRKRFQQHLGRARAGSPLKFYRILKGVMENKRRGQLLTSVIAYADSIDEAFELEESAVDGFWRQEQCLNTIPGGKAGLAYLAKHNLLGKDKKYNPDKREKLLEKYIRENPRAGLPAPWVSDSWKDDDQYIKRVFGRQNTLKSPEQLFELIELDKQGKSHESICEILGINSVQTVKNVLSGKTYQRITKINVT